MCNEIYVRRLPRKEETVAVSSKQAQNAELMFGQIETIRNDASKLASVARVE